MLAERIHNTLRFFDLQNLPLTAQEIYKYLIAETTALRAKLDNRYDLQPEELPELQAVHFDTILTQLYILTREGKVGHSNGFYSLPGKENLILDRQKIYLNGLKREKLIRRYLLFTRHIPFVRGIALAGSQALGQQRAISDIDLLIITDPNFMWTARTMLSAWFQVFGVRRYGKKITNRFCLNHYLSAPTELISGRNLYTALEYSKLRSVVYPQMIAQFQKINQAWMNQFFPNLDFRSTDILEASPNIKSQSRVQSFLEKIFKNALGQWIETQLGAWQKKRVHQDEFVFVHENELSFHPDSKQETLLKTFFK